MKPGLIQVCEGEGSKVSINLIDAVRGQGTERIGIFAEKTDWVSKEPGHRLGSGSPMEAVSCAREHTRVCGCEHLSDMPVETTC